LVYITSTGGVSKLLGHANIRVTQECYAELLDKTVEEQFYAVLNA
jgi:hypothetical protein